MAAAGTPQGKFKRLSKTSVSCRIIAATIAILLPLFLVFLVPSIIFSKSMIDYSGMDVKNLSDEQMKILIGRKFSDTANSDPDVITSDKLPKNCRVIPPGSVVTMDYVEDRLNVHLDSQGNIKKVKKG